MVGKEKAHKGLWLRTDLKTESRGAGPCEKKRCAAGGLRELRLVAIFPGAEEISAGRGRHKCPNSAAKARSECGGREGSAFARDPRQRNGFRHLVSERILRGGLRPIYEPAES